MGRRETPGRARAKEKARARRAPKEKARGTAKGTGRPVRLTGGRARARARAQAQEHDRCEVFNVSLFRKLGDLGLLGVTVDEAWGGSGMDATAAVVAPP